MQSRFIHEKPPNDPRQPVGQRQRHVGVVWEPPIRGRQEYSTARNPETFAYKSGLPRAIAHVLNHSVAEDKVEGVVPEGKLTAVAPNHLNLRMNLPESTHGLDGQPYNSFGPRIRCFQEVLDTRTPICC
jgi:hypothetical protein